MDILVSRQPETNLSECVTSITILSDGKIQLNVSWKVASLSNLSGVVIQPDTDNHNMYLVDDLGNRMDHIETGGDTIQQVELFNGQTKEGWFLFPTPHPSASSFYFVDDDNGVRSSRLNRQWP